MTVNQLIAEIDPRIEGHRTGHTAHRALLRYAPVSPGMGGRAVPSGARRPRETGPRPAVPAGVRGPGGDPRLALAPATAVELVHNFSLIHDDIQDRSEYRRHRPTVWSVWGSPQAINAGDGMFTAAQLALAEDEEPIHPSGSRGFRRLNHACRMLCEGQYLDLDFERRVDVSGGGLPGHDREEDRVPPGHGLLSGRAVWRRGLRDRARYREFGLQMGLAFQMQDDHLGNWGDPRVTGKPAADDVVNKKKTLPLLYSLEAASAPERETLLDILSGPGLAGRRRHRWSWTSSRDAGRRSTPPGKSRGSAIWRWRRCWRPLLRDPAGAEMAALVKKLVVRTS